MLRLGDTVRHRRFLQGWDSGISFGSLSMGRKTAQGGTRHRTNIRLRCLEQQRSISNFPCSLTRNITSHSMKNLAFHSLPGWNVIILPILTTLLVHFSLKGWENVRLGSERVERSKSFGRRASPRRRELLTWWKTCGYIDISVSNSDLLLMNECRSSVLLRTLQFIIH